MTPPLFGRRIKFIKVLIRAGSIGIVKIKITSANKMELRQNLKSFNICQKLNTPGPRLMRIHLVRYSTSARYEKYSNIHLVRPIIHLVRIFALSE